MTGGLGPSGLRIYKAELKVGQMSLSETETAFFWGEQIMFSDLGR